MAREPQKPNEQQMAWNNAYTQGMNKQGLRRAHQIVKARSFVYDGSLAPRCLSCGGPRGKTRGLKCIHCES